MANIHIIKCSYENKKIKDNNNITVTELAEVSNNDGYPPAHGHVPSIDTDKLKMALSKHISEIGEENIISIVPIVEPARLSWLSPYKSSDEEYNNSGFVKSISSITTAFVVVSRDVVDPS